jgi:hypothetical protein
MKLNVNVDGGAVDGGGEPAEDAVPEVIPDDEPGTEDEGRIGTELEGSQHNVPRQLARMQGNTDLKFADGTVTDKVDTATELVTTTADEIVDTAVVAPVDANELSPRDEDPVGIETVGKFGGDVADVLGMVLVSCSAWAATLLYSLLALTLNPYHWTDVHWTVQQFRWILHRCSRLRSTRNRMLVCWTRPPGCCSVSASLV